MITIVSKKRVLITGGAGFIGANLARRLLSLGYNVNILTRSSTNLWRLKDILEKIKICQVNIFDKQDLSKKIKKINPSIIIHLATYSQYRNQNDFEKMVDTNIQATLNILIVSKNINYDLFINTGSSSEYGIKKNPMTETDFLEPISFYAATKASSSLLCQVFCKEYNKPIVTLRPFSVYGPYEEKDRFIPTIMKALIRNKPINLTPGSQRRDFIFIDDIIDIYLKTIENGHKLSGEILNMGTGKEYTNDEVIETLFKVTNKKVLIKKGTFPKRIWDMPHWVADIHKTQRILSWKPKYNLSQGLLKNWNWFKESCNEIKH